MCVHKHTRKNTRSGQMQTGITLAIANVSRYGATHDRTTTIIEIIIYRPTIIWFLANCRSQLLLDCFGRCIKLFVSTESTSSHEFSSQFGLAFLYAKNIQKLSRRPALAQVSVEWTSIDRRKEAVKPVTVDRSPATIWAATTAIIAATDWAKPATTIVNTFTAWKMWFTNYYVAYAFV